MQEPIEISFVIPAYQEERRIGQTIERVSAYLEEHHPRSEVILVCDGCSDQTALMARQSFKGFSCQLRVIELPVNRGKGNAVKEGMLAGNGTYLFFTDADLSYAPELTDSFLQQLQDGADIVIAQRQKTVTYSGSGRRSLAVLSRAIIGNIILPGIRDTQAGFKGFRNPVAKKLFSRLKTRGFLFDLEILLAARRRGYRIEKVYVDWCDRPGSTVRLVKDTTQAIIDLTLICLRELTVRLAFWTSDGK
jgi:dolichyl-phosphate beta-glucosyltransferase